jgi:hypothetical protein
MIVEKFGSDNTRHLDIGTINHMSHDIKWFVAYNKWGQWQLVYLDDNITHQIIGQRNVFIKRTPRFVNWYWGQLNN